MKKIILILLAVILLTACQPPAPAEVPADSINDILGIWWFPQGGMKVEFKADGTVRVFSGSANIGTIDEGNYTFDAGKITFTGSAACDVDPTTYEAYVTTEDGEPISLRLQVVGTDACADRAKALVGMGKFQIP